MTEAEWLACAEPQKLLRFFSARVSVRRRRLFACACCHRIRHLLSVPEFFRAVELAELYADDDSVEAECRQASETVRDYYCSATPENDYRNCADLAVVWASDVRPSTEFAEHALDCALSKAEMVVRHRAWSLTDKEFIEPAMARFPQDVKALIRALEAQNDFTDREVNSFRVQEWAQQMTLLRDIFGNPFRPVAFSHEWRTSTAVALARQMYESRDFSAMPILADALQDAGCQVADILEHCQNEKVPHVRGCWVADLVLGKS